MSTASEVIDKTKIQELLDSVRSQFITPYKDENPLTLREIKSTTDLSKSNSTPLEELSKLAKMIKAHTTKVGIVCHPDKFKDEANDVAIFKELTALVNVVFFLFSLLPLFYSNKKDQYAEFFLDQLSINIMRLLNGISQLTDDLDAMIADKFDEVTDSENRLVSIGMIWASCDALNVLASKGNAGLLCDNIRGSCQLVDDIQIDIEEWLEDPQLGNGMLLEESFDSEEDEEFGNEVDEEETASINRIKKFLEIWQVNIKMIKLLLSSFTKSISQATNKEQNNYKGSSLDLLQALHSKVVGLLDEIVADTFIADSSFQHDDSVEDIELLNKSLKEMVKIIKDMNKSDPKNSKWIEVWETKYSEKQSK